MFLILVLNVTLATISAIGNMGDIQFFKLIGSLNIILLLLPEIVSISIGPSNVKSMYLALMLMITSIIVWWYLLSCLIVWIYKKLKK